MSTTRRRTFLKQSSLALTGTMLAGSHRSNAGDASATTCQAYLGATALAGLRDRADLPLRSSDRGRRVCFEQSGEADFRSRPSTTRRGWIRTSWLEAAKGGQERSTRSSLRPTSTGLCSGRVIFIPTASSRRSGEAARATSWPNFVESCGKADILPRHLLQHASERLLAGVGGTMSTGARDRETEAQKRFKPNRRGDDGGALQPVRTARADLVRRGS